MESNVYQLRKAIKAQFPGLKFKVRTVDFTDLARDSKIFVEFDARGMTCKECGHKHILTKWVKQRLAFYCPMCGADLEKQLKQIEAIVKQHNAIVSW